ncbi:MAG: hypothetical protein MR510_07185 [Clostridium sp.]|uniref:hypothetical protein n=1 Tax=Clostridium sp. TaxID=1506 RepID=UPI002A750AD5|nr:hypothetical protein [Clostridium sp.]MCI6692252.1 hypothetical protein [Clostridium sp.]MDY2630437.1 hypothetical protein [Clostridium sp.]MDY4251891.1 hypothetical protein [Clostridium sp.]
MKWIENLFLTEDEIKFLSIYLVYGVGLGILIGLFFSKIELFFALGGVISIIVSIGKIYIDRSKKSKELI